MARFKFLWLKGALRFIAKLHPTLAVVSAIRHCSALGWKERALVGSESGCLIGQGSVHTCFWLVAFGGQASFSLVIGLINCSERCSSLSCKSIVCSKT